jgi:hypothetical protein
LIRHETNPWCFHAGSADRAGCVTGGGKRHIRRAFPFPHPPYPHVKSLQHGEFPRLLRKQLRENAVVGVLWTSIYLALHVPAANDLISIAIRFSLLSLYIAQAVSPRLPSAALEKSNGRHGCYC